MGQSKPAHRQKTVQAPQPKHQTWIKHHRKRNAAITVAIVSALKAVIVIATIATLPRPSVKVGQQAPDFSLSDVNGSGMFSLSEQKGKPVFIEFMRTECPYCQQQAPILQQTFGSYGGRVVYVSITIDPNVDSPNMLMAFAQNHQSMGSQAQPWHWLRDDLANPVQDQYGVNGATPTMFMLDSKGVVQARFVGLTQMSDLQTAFQKIL